MPTPVITLGSVALPGDLRWSDEFSWSVVARNAEWSLTGALLVQESIYLAGRTITLEGKSESIGYIWLERSVILALQALVATPLWTGTLTLADGRTYPVAFRDEGLTAEPVQHQASTADLNTLPYTYHPEIADRLGLPPWRL